MDQHFSIRVEYLCLRYETDVFVILKNRQVPRFRVFEFFHNHLHGIVDVDHHGRSRHEIPHVSFRVQFLVKHHVANVIQQDDPQ